MARIRRERGDGALFFNAIKDRWVGQLDLGRDLTGKRLRPTVTARTRTSATTARRHPRSAGTLDRVDRATPSEPKRVGRTEGGQGGRELDHNRGIPGTTLTWCEQQEREVPDDIPRGRRRGRRLAGNGLQRPEPT